MILNVLRIIFGSIFILFLPGYTWSFIFFKRGKIDLIERIALSFGLSIALVPLTVFYLNYLLKVKISLADTSIVVGTLVAIPLAFVGAKSLLGNLPSQNRK